MVKSIRIKETKGLEERVDAMLEVLQGMGVPGLEDLDRSSPVPSPGPTGIQNVALVLRSGNPSRMSRNLVRELGELAASSSLMSAGPAAVLVGGTTGAFVESVKPQPTVVHSSLRQDQAVHAAMENVLTVVTGPPGTGKSQVLVNAVAAAVTRGESVLLASKNNKAVDVVVQRLGAVSPHAAVIRTGAANKRREVAEKIARLVGESRKPGRPPQVVEAHAAWLSESRTLQKIYQVLDDRRRLADELSGLNRELTEHLRAGSTLEGPNVDPKELGKAADEVLTTLERFGDSLGLFGRGRKHERRLEDARRALDAFAALSGLRRSEVGRCLSGLVDGPTRSRAAVDAFVPIRDRALRDARVADKMRRREAVRERLAGLPDEHDLEDRLSGVSPGRLSAGGAFFEERWREIQAGEREAWKEADRLASTLKKVAKGDARPREGLRAVPGTLPALPVWATTNLSAGANLPLLPELFDLVIVDEAAQCDVASALPLLVRGKRALIVGDERQLTHITSLGEGREEAIAMRCGLDEEELANFSYRAQSCFSLAKARIPDLPISLNLHFRSHPGVVGFSDRQFYGNDLTMCSTERPPDGMRALEWQDVSGACMRGRSGRSWRNPREARVAVEGLLASAPAYEELGLTVGVVTPYAAQAGEIKERLRGAGDERLTDGIEVATAHRFQGDERDVIYISPVIDRKVRRAVAEFAADSNLLNVALTRARRRVVVVGDRQACGKHATALRELAEYVGGLEDSGFDSPLEERLHGALRERGIDAVPGERVGGYVLDLTVRHNGLLLDLECDGAPFHRDVERDSLRDRDLTERGWKVLRFSGRRIKWRLDDCVAEVAAALAHSRRS